MRITKIAPQSRNPGRKNIFVDGEFRAGVSDETLLRFGLRTGDVIGADLLGALKQAEELFNAKSVALRFLSYRPRTEREVRDKLREKEFADEEIAHTIGELKQARLLDDAEFARMFIRNTQAVRPAGTMAIKRKLLALGVGRDVIDAALHDSLTPEDQRSAARTIAQQFIRKRRQAGKRADERIVRQRLIAALLRRGSTWETVDVVVKETLGTDVYETDQ
jgi:regulatory protein